MPPKSIGPDVHKRIEVDRGSWGLSTKKIEDFRRYANGDQLFQFTKGQKEVLEGILQHNFCDNVTNTILTTNADELELLGFSSTDDVVQEYLNNFWLLNRIDDENGTATYATLRDANYCMLTTYDPDQKRSIVTREPWWNGACGAFVGYDTSGRMLYAVREWRDTDGNLRRIVYYDGFFERYISSGSGLRDQSPIWSSYTAKGEVGNVVETLRPDGTPLGIPIVHFANSSRGPTNYGFSEIDGGVLAFQDQINDIHFDISAAARMTGFAELALVGWPIARNPANSELIPVKRGPGVVHQTDKIGADAKTLPAGDITQQVLAYKNKIESVCRMTSTPLQYITGVWPSGEALWQSMRPLLKKAKQQQKRFKVSWVQLVHRAIELENVYGRLGLNEDVKTAPITTLWTPIERRDPLTEAMAQKNFWDAATAAGIAGCPINVYLKTQGWSKAAIDELMAERETQRQLELKHQSDQAAITAKFAPKPAHVGAGNAQNQ